MMCWYYLPGIWISIVLYANIFFFFLMKTFICLAAKGFMVTFLIFDVYLAWGKLININRVVCMFYLKKKKSMTNFQTYNVFGDYKC